MECGREYNYLRADEDNWLSYFVSRAYHREDLDQFGDKLFREKMESDLLTAFRNANASRVAGENADVKKGTILFVPEFPGVRLRCETLSDYNSLATQNQTDEKKKSALKVGVIAAIGLGLYLISR